MTNMPRVLCARCGRSMVHAESGVIVEAILADGSSYYKVHADVHACPECGALVYVGFGRVVERHEPGYGEIVVHRQVQLEPHRQILETMQPACKNCRWWNARPQYGDGSCDFVGTLPSEAVATKLEVFATAADDYQLESELRTGPEFVCLHHLPQEA